LELVAQEIPEMG
jgi:hypothetical protein